ncbi:hypothetical protein PMY35_17645 [Clostridium tertium]|uniref:hypothetical protein n=2 Tax=Clostridium tertium TaxID=1559 RepID=UPI0020296421|nr:hypothetical protein [Clostridium tertium]MDB1949626.1 hypothetical protein [Clostridium tertium]
MVKKNINYTKKEFLQEYGINENKFRLYIEDVMTYFNLKKESIKRDLEESANYEIPYEIAPLLAMMISIAANKSISPYRDDRKDKNRISSTECIKYNEFIIEELEKLPEYLKNNIKEHYFYKINVELHKYIPLLQDRLNTILSIIRYKNKITSGNIILDIVNDLDEIINKYLYSFQSELENKEDLKYIDKILSNEFDDKYLYKNKKYNIDSLITEIYNKFNPWNNKIILSENFLERIPNHEEKSIQELRQEYLEELNLNAIDSKINTFFDNFDRNIEDKIKLLSSKSKYFEENKKKIIQKYINIINFTYDNYVKGNNINNSYIGIDIDTLEDYFKYIQKSNCKEKIIKKIATDLVEENILTFRKLEILKNNINKKVKKDLINKKVKKDSINKKGEEDLINESLDNLLGQILLDLLNDN